MLGFTIFNGNGRTQRLRNVNLSVCCSNRSVVLRARFQEEERPGFFHATSNLHRGHFRSDSGLGRYPDALWHLCGRGRVRAPSLNLDSSEALAGDSVAMAGGGGGGFKKPGGQG